MQTLILLILPLLAATGALVVRNGQLRVYALISSLIQLVAAGAAMQTMSVSENGMLVFDTEWIPSLGVHLKLQLDGLSVLMVMLTNVLVPLIVLSTFRSSRSIEASFIALIFLMQAALNGVFLAADGFLFYVFWELALLPIWFICLRWGGADRNRITLKFFLYTLAGSLLMLMGFILLYLETPAPHSFSLEALYAVRPDADTQSLLFWLFFLAFAVKIPVFPFHTWQPDTYTDAPVQGTMLLSGIMLKMGIYGIMRWMLPVMPDGIDQWGSTALLLCAIGIVYASLIAMRQRDFKRLIAYSSIAHVGLITAGVFSLNMQGLQGATVQMLAHGVNVVGLFFICELLERRMNTRSLDGLGGLAHNTPVFTVLFVIILLGSVALPLTNGFVGEFLLLNGVYQSSAILAAVCGLTVILGAVYMLRAYQHIMLGEQRPENVSFTRLSTSETAVLLIVGLLVIAAGIYPSPILQTAQPVLEGLLSTYQDLN
ncbi:MAG: NuoM family protein [Bacteroidota bacterium]